MSACYFSRTSASSSSTFQVLSTFKDLECSRLDACFMNLELCCFRCGTNSSASVVVAVPDIDHCLTDVATSQPFRLTKEFVEISCLGPSLIQFSFVDIVVYFLATVLLPAGWLIAPRISLGNVFVFTSFSYQMVCFISCHYRTLYARRWRSLCFVFVCAC